MLTDKEIKSCVGCHACYNICPKKAIEMKSNKEGFLYPEIDNEKCVNCDLCLKVCPLLNKNNKKEILPEAYACYNKDENILKNSSSGGIFYLLAKEIINKDGIVFGAAFDKLHNVRHIKIECIEDIPKLMGSKYVQSIIGNSYKEVKLLLEEDKYVLFTGTPCQIEGLRSYLGKNYDKLYLQDIICHGVPSPKIWMKYKQYLESKHNSKIEEISFRNKSKSWATFSLWVKFENGEEHLLDKNKDPYLKIFLNDIVLRESCYDCKFKKVNRLSDITLADFWGISKIDKDISNKLGTSLVILNSDKGRKIFDDIKNDITYKKENFTKAISVNKNMIYSAIRKSARKHFFNNLEEMNFESKKLEKYIKSTVFRKNIDNIRNKYRKIVIMIKYRKLK